MAHDRLDAQVAVVGEEDNIAQQSDWPGACARHEALGAIVAEVRARLQNEVVVLAGRLLRTPTHPSFAYERRSIVPPRRAHHSIPEKTIEFPNSYTTHVEPRTALNSSLRK